MCEGRGGGGGERTAQQFGFIQSEMSKRKHCHQLSWPSLNNNNHQAVSYSTQICHHKRSGCRACNRVVVLAALQGNRGDWSWTPLGFWLATIRIPNHGHRPRKVWAKPSYREPGGETTRSSFKRHPFRGHANI